MLVNSQLVSSLPRVKRIILSVCFQLRDLVQVIVKEYFNLVNGSIDEVCSGLGNNYFLHMLSQFQKDTYRKASMKPPHDNLLFSYI